MSARPRNINKRRSVPRVFTNLFPERVKWYAGEIQFLARPTVRQIRAVEEVTGDWTAGPVGVDGAMLHVGKWPAVYEGTSFIAGLQRVGLPMRFRVAPRGRDCDGGCLSADPCPLGDCAACNPEWRDEDWRELNTTSD